MGIKKLEEVGSVWVNPKDTPLSKEELQARIQDAQALVCLLTDKIDQSLMENSSLKVIANYAVGFDNIDISYAQKKGVFVTNTPGVLTDTTADMAWALMMSISRRLSESEEYLKQGRFKGWSATLLLGHEISGKTLGIIGAGRIGTATALRSRGFDMRVLYASPRPNLEMEEQVGAKHVSLEELLRESDFVSLHVPSNEKTKYLINKNTLKIMKSSAFLINTARGVVVKEEDLIEALAQGIIAGAALDVFEFEPQIADSLLKMKNLLAVPHVASATHEARNKMSLMAATNVVSVFQGKSPPNLVGNLSDYQG